MAQPQRSIEIKGEKTIPTPQQKRAAVLWFAELRDKLCAALEAIEAEAGSANKFVKKDWKRNTGAEDQSAPSVVREPSGDIAQSRLREAQSSRAQHDARMAQIEENGGGGTMALLRGTVFEKAGVNISEVHGQFSKEFRGQIPGADGALKVAGSEQSERTAEQSRQNYIPGNFWAAGISMVVHPAHPKVPAVHMNTRHIVTSQGWFGGGGDLNPVFPDALDTADFHAALKAACDTFSPEYYPRYKTWCDEYFFIPHRNKPRGVGGIFYDSLGSGDWDKDFAFTKAVGEAVLNIYPQLVRRHMNKPFTAEEREQQLIWRGHYAEFNLAYDRGTKFGLATGGNTEAILMSLPPEAKWP